MTKQFTFLSIILSTLILPQLVHAEIYKNVDAEGRVTYSNVKIKGAKKLNLEPADTNFGTANSSGEAKRTPSTRNATPAGFPKVDAGTQNQRDRKRKEILQTELETEKKALEDARKAYAEGESNPEVYKTADGKTMRNVPKFEGKMKTLQADIDAHQRNVQLLEKEISTIN